MLAVSKTTSIFKPTKFLHIRAGGHTCFGDTPLERGNDKKVTAQKMALVLGVSDKTIKRHIKHLNEQSRIQRVGSDKACHWEIIERPVSHDDVGAGLAPAPIAPAPIELGQPHWGQPQGLPLQFRTIS